MVSVVGFPLMFVVDGICSSSIYFFPCCSSSPRGVPGEYALYYLGLSEVVKAFLPRVSQMILQMIFFFPPRYRTSKDLRA